MGFGRFINFVAYRSDLWSCQFRAVYPTFGNKLPGPKSTKENLNLCFQPAAASLWPTPHTQNFDKIFFRVGNTL
jgi:hypothetical protein